VLQSSGVIPALLPTFFFDTLDKLFTLTQSLLGSESNGTVVDVGQCGVNPGFSDRSIKNDNGPIGRALGSSTGDRSSTYSHNDDRASNNGTEDPSPTTNNNNNIFAVTWLAQKWSTAKTAVKAAGKAWTESWMQSGGQQVLLAAETGVEQKQPPAPQCVAFVGDSGQVRTVFQSQV
jgi:hypothetical protein